MIRKATINDLEQIHSLYKEYSLDISHSGDIGYATKFQRDGFLIAVENKEDIAKRIQNDTLYDVFEENNKIAGFININKEIYFPEEADNIIWFDNESKQKYFHADTAITLHEIIIDQVYKGNGIGKQLLEYSLRKLKEKDYTDLFSIIALAPLTNCASLLFHTRNGFERACVTMPIELFGLKNYQSLLFHKKIF